jgi:hypothetical protein
MHQPVLQPTEILVTTQVDYSHFPVTNFVEITSDTNPTESQTAIFASENADFSTARENWYRKEPKLTFDAAAVMAETTVRSISRRGSSRLQKKAISIQSHDFNAPKSIQSSSQRLKPQLDGETEDFDDLSDLISTDDEENSAERCQNATKDIEERNYDPASTPKTPAKSAVRVMNLELPTTNMSHATNTRPKSYAQALVAAAKVATAAVEEITAELEAALAIKDGFVPSRPREKQPYIITGLNKAIVAVLQPKHKRNLFRTSRPISAGTLKKQVATLQATIPDGKTSLRKIAEQQIISHTPAIHSQPPLRPEMTVDGYVTPCSRSLSRGSSYNPSESGFDQSVYSSSRFSSAGQPFVPSENGLNVPRSSSIPSMTVTDDNNATRFASIMGAPSDPHLYSNSLIPTLSTRTRSGILFSKNESSYNDSSDRKQLPFIAPSPAPSMDATSFSAHVTSHSHSNYHLPAISALCPTPWRTRPSSASSSMGNLLLDDLNSSKKKEEHAEQNSSPTLLITPEEFQRSLTVLSVTGSETLSDSNSNSNIGLSRQLSDTNLAKKGSYMILK